MKPQKLCVYTRMFWIEWVEKCESLPVLYLLNRMDWALRISTMFWGSGPSTNLDLLHRNSYALFTCSNISYRKQIKQYTINNWAHLTLQVSRNLTLGQLNFALFWSQSHFSSIYSFHKTETEIRSELILHVLWPKG